MGRIAGIPSEPEEVSVLDGKACFALGLEGLPVVNTIQAVF